MRAIHAATAASVVMSITIMSGIAAQGSQHSDTTPPFKPAQSLIDLDKWFRSGYTLVLDGSYQVTTEGPTSRWTSTYGISNVSLTKCTLALRATEQENSDAPGSRVIKAMLLPLMNLDIGQLRATEDPVPNGYTKSRPSYSLTLVSRPDRDSAFTVETRIPNQPTTTRSEKSVDIHLSSDYTANNYIIPALRRAAVLCGAPNVPLRVMPNAPAATQSATASSLPARPAAQSPTGMTNDDVVKLVAAGLSNQVVATSIGQARSTAFDITPTGLIGLKNARVPDTVIAVMQSRAASPSSEPKPVPKYDTSLKATPKMPAGPPGCTGIEMMGLYKNDALPTAMGGGVVQWLAKIRNNTGVATIVAFTWTDMNGQTKRSQVQIEGGRIATVELDVTQARLIAPVSNLQLASCQ